MNEDPQVPPETLIGLLNRYSPSKSEGEAVLWLVGRLRSLGYDQAYVDEAGNAVGVMGSGPRQMFLLGHIDTVPGEIPVRFIDGKVYGRGAVDAKGPLGVFVDAVAEVGAIQGWQFVVIGALDEEGDSAGARHIAARPAPEFAIIGEPSRWERITLGYKGSAWAWIKVRQPKAHTAGRDPSACEAVVGVWKSIQDWSETYNMGREKFFDCLQPTLRGLSSGENGFEEWAGLQVGVRLPPGFSPEAWFDQLSMLAGEARVEPRGFATAAFQEEKRNNRLVSAFMAGIRAAGGRPSFVLKSGTSDMNIVGPAWRCPMVTYGPGDSALDHTPDEHISLDEYSRAVKVLRAVLEQLSHTPVG